MTQPAEKPQEIQVHVLATLLEYVAALPQMVALWKQWADEEGREKADADAWACDVVNRLLTGTYRIITAWDDARLIGFVHAIVQYWPALGVKAGFGEKAYVHPDYRGRGVFAMMIDEAERIGDEEGVEERFLSGRIDGFTVEAYKRRGYEPVDILMRKKNGSGK